LQRLVGNPETTDDLADFGVRSHPRRLPRQEKVTPARNSHT
jgi:hypothetical protein